MPDTMLILEDERLLGGELKRHHAALGWHVLLARSCAEARSTLVDKAIEPLVVLADMSLPDGNALDLLESIRDRVTGEWLILPGYGSAGDSVRALRLGAFDFLEKPCPTERLDLVVAGAARSARAHRRIREQAAHHSARYGPEACVGRSAPAREVREMLGKLFRVPMSAVVLTGETGTGKGLAARILHHSGLRADGPIVQVNCAALPRELLESELFGHEPGAFTGATKRRRGLVQQAGGGTLFLHEIEEMSIDLQSKLLRAIEDRSTRWIGGFVSKALELAHDNVTQAARLLGTTRQTMRYRIQKHGLQAKDDGGDGDEDG